MAGNCWHLKVRSPRTGAVLDTNGKVVGTTEGSILVIGLAKHVISAKHLISWGLQHAERILANNARAAISGNCLNCE